MQRGPEEGVPADGHTSLRAPIDYFAGSALHRRRLEILRLVLAGPDPGSVQDDPGAIDVLDDLVRRYEALGSTVVVQNSLRRHDRPECARAPPSDPQHRFLGNQELRHTLSRNARGLRVLGQHATLPPHDPAGGNQS